MLREKADQYVRGGGVWETLALLFGNGLATSDGEPWRRQRRLMQPQFHPKRLAQLAPAMATAIKREIEPWQRLAEGGHRVDLVEDMKRLTMVVFLTAMFGTDISQSDANLAGKSISESLKYVQTRMLFHWLPSFIPAPGEAKFRRAMQCLDGIVRNVIDSRGDTDGTQDLLALLLSARFENGRRMSREQVRDEVFTFFIAGYETTATAMMWTFYLLCKHPEAEERIRAELRAVLGGRDPSYEDLAKLPYTSMVIQESMRLYPPVWIILRQSRDDDQIGGYRIPKGSFVVVLPATVHRHPAFWDDPDTFRPERFAEDASAGRPRSAFMPFGVGPHLCIGNNFAMLESAVILASIVPRYTMKLPPGFQAVPKLIDTIRPVNGLPVTLERLG